MKKFLILPLLLCAQWSFSQTYLSLPDSNAKWINVHKDYRTNPWNPTKKQVQYCTANRDTLINGREYFQIDTCNGGYKGALRNDAGKVHIVPKDSAREFLLYDFTLEVGDTICNINCDGTQSSLLIVHPGGVDSVLIDSVYRKRIRLSYGTGWIEGIGNSQGLFWESSGNISGYELELYCMSVNSKTIYPDAGFGPCESSFSTEEHQTAGDIAVYPNPSAAEVNIRSVLPLQSVSLTDLRGNNLLVVENLSQKNFRLSLSGYPRGVYLLVLRTSNGLTTKRIVSE